MATENGDSGLGAQDATNVTLPGAEPTSDLKGKGKAVATEEDLKDTSMAEDDDDDDEDGGEV